MSQVMPSKMEEFLTSRASSRRADLIVRLAAVSGALVLLLLAGLLVRPVNDLRRKHQIVLDDESLKGLPPDIALLTKTGTLRALAVDIAFIRMEDLKQNNRFYELMQLSDWLCKLAPRYASVWSYSAWNMAYNISVSQHTPEARWMWVNNGIENLRNRGLRYNPNSIKLYRELAGTFYHKIGDKLDDYHMEYKKELAVQMERIFGEPPLAATDEQVIADFREIVDAPRDLDAWIERTPAARELVEQLAGEGLKPDISLLDFVARNMRTYTDVAEFAKAEIPAPTRELTARRAALLSAPRYAETAETLIAAVRSRVIREDFNMNLEWMLELMEAPEWMAAAPPSDDAGGVAAEEMDADAVTDGAAAPSRHMPVDWRSPFAHTLYWATYGDMITATSHYLDPSDSMNTVRCIFFALKSMGSYGKIMLEPNFDVPNRSFLQLLPDTRYIWPMHQAYLYFGKEQFGDDPRFRENTAGPNYHAGHQSFLMKSIRQLYFEGGQANLELAKRLYFYLRNYDTEEDGRVKPQYILPFKEFVERDMYGELESQENATRFISELLVRSLKDAADGEIRRSVAHFNEAKKWWTYYMRDTGTDRNTRRKLEAIGVMRRDVAAGFMQSPQFSGLQKARLWQRLDLVTKRAIYDQSIEIVRVLCERRDPPLDVDKVMPIPPGMEEHRANPDAVIKALERFDESVSQGEQFIPE